MSCAGICACQFSIIKLKWYPSTTGAIATLVSSWYFLCSFSTAREQESFLHCQRLRPEYLKYVVNKLINTSIFHFLEQEN